MSIVYVSHAAEEVLWLADTVVRLAGGRVVAAGAPDVILSGPGRSGEEDVARRLPEAMSILNVVPARVVSLGSGAEPHNEVGLRPGGGGVEGAVLWARITRRSLREPGLGPGDRVSPLVKCVSLAPEEGGAPGGG